MTPSERLRAAAQLIRDLAEEVTPGPWGVTTYGGWGPASPPTVYRRGVDRDGEPWLVTRPENPGDATWISLLGPDKAEPLATVFDIAAEDFEHLQPGDKHLVLTDILDLADALLRNPRGAPEARG